MMKKILTLLLLIVAFSGSAQKQLMNHDLWNSLLQKHVSPTGNVNYIGFMKDSASLYEYFLQLSKKHASRKLEKRRETRLLDQYV